MRYLETASRYALFGHPVSHSRSPDIHRAFARETGEALRYELVDVDAAHFAPCVRRFFADGGRGANVTLPHKVAAFELADHVSSDAYRAGAINTLAVLDDGRLFGDNTDGAGLIRDLTVNLGVDVEGRRVLLLGAGGAARGAVGPLLDEGPSELVIANRDATKAASLARLFTDGGKLQAVPLGDVSGAFDLVINATSASLQGEVPRIPDDVFAPGSVAYDMVYSDVQTPFLSWADSRGAARLADGWGMMVEQAAEAFFIWRGVRPTTSPLLRRTR